MTSILRENLSRIKRLPLDTEDESKLERALKELVSNWEQFTTKPSGSSLLIIYHCITLARVSGSQAIQTTTENLWFFGPDKQNIGKEDLKTMLKAGDKIAMGRLESLEGKEWVRLRPYIEKVMKTQKERGCCIAS